MADIKTPEKYINKPGIVKEAGKYIKVYGTKILIVAGTKGYASVEKNLTASLAAEHIDFSLKTFAGYATFDKAREVALEALENEVQVLIAIGGGRVMDVVKAAGSISKLPVVTIPTTAAQCASWAAVSIIYNEEGDFVRGYNNRYTPKLILVDPEVLVNTPERFIKAGIADTYAKWFEVVLGVTGKEDSLPLQISDFGSKLAFSILDEKSEKAIEANRNHLVTKDFIDVLDAIYFLAGFVGSFVGEKVYLGFAHPFYNASRRVASTRTSLHGEVVAFGILTQLVLEGKEESYIHEIIDKFAKIDMAFTLADIGLGEDTEEKVAIIAERTFKDFGIFREYGFGNSVDEIKAAIYKASQLVEQKRK